MAKVNIDFDTKTKELNVKFDGKAVDNVYAVSLSKSYYGDDKNENPYSISLMTLDSSKQEEEGYRHMEHIIAKESKEGKEALEAGAASHPIFPDLLLLKKSTSNIEKSMSEILKSYRGR